MKLSGNKRNGRYIAGNERYQMPQSNRNQASQANRSQAPQTSRNQVPQASRNQVPQTNRSQREQPIDPKKARAAAKRKKMRRVRNILIAVIVIIVTLSAVLFSVYKLGVRPPEMVVKPPITNTPSADVTEGAAMAPAADRKGVQYTFVILGFDDGNGNSDTIMVANFNVDSHKLSVVNIPRDTLVNVKWNLKKANTLYANGGMESVTAGLSDVLGFPVDFYVKVNLKAFSHLVDAVGGVDFDVPVKMDYDDPAQDLHIHLKPGLQHLDGAKALQVVRCRSVYSTADIGRIETQQLFLKSAAEQILQNQSKLKITDLAGIFINDVETSLDLGEVVWLGKEFYKMDSENITFATIPANYWDTVNKTSYVTIYVNDWLKLLNEKINPYKDAVTAKDLSILTRDDKGNLYVTNGVYAGKKSWGSGSSGSADNNNSGSASPKPSASPSPSPSETPEPSPSPSPSPSDEQPSPSEESSPDVTPTEPTGDVTPSPTPDSGQSPDPGLDQD